MKSVDAIRTTRASLLFPCLILATGLLSGCSAHYSLQDPVYPWEADEPAFAGDVYSQCDGLMGGSRGVRKDRAKLVVTSFAPLGDLESSTGLGRLLGQQCATRVVAQGYQVTEVLLAESLLVAPRAGELLLSRDLNVIANDHDADHAVVGTYSVGMKQIFVTAKLVRTEDAQILAARSFQLPITQETRALLR